MNDDEGEDVQAIDIEDSGMSVLKDLFVDDEPQPKRKAPQ